MISIQGSTQRAAVSSQPPNTQPAESRQNQVTVNSWGRTVKAFFTAFVESLDPRDVAPGYKKPDKHVGLPSIGFEKIDHATQQPKRSVDYVIDVLDFATLPLKLTSSTIVPVSLHSAAHTFSLFKPLIRELAHQCSDSLHSSLGRYFEDKNSLKSGCSSSCASTGGTLTKLMLQGAAISALVSAGKACESAESIPVGDAAVLSRIGIDPDLPLNGTYALAGNINANTIKTPIGGPTEPFTGHINGNGFTISNTSACFIQSLNGNISNVVFVNADVQSSRHAGVVACKAFGESKINNVVVKSSRVFTYKDNAPAGGIVGEAEGNTQINRTAVVNSTVKTTGKQGSAALIAGKAAGNSAIAYNLVFDSTAKTSGEFSPCAAVVGEACESVTLKNLVVRETEISTSGLDSVAAVGAGVIKGQRVNLDTLKVSDCSVETQGIHANIGIGAGVSLNGTVRNVFAHNSSIQGSGDYIVMGFGTGGIYGSGQLENIVVAQCNVENSGYFSNSGFGTGESTASVGIIKVTVLNSNLTLSGHHPVFASKSGTSPTVCGTLVNGEAVSTGNCKAPLFSECAYFKLSPHDVTHGRSLEYATNSRSVMNDICQTNITVPVTEVIQSNSSNSSQPTKEPEHVASAVSCGLLSCGVLLVGALYSIKQWYAGYQNGLRGQELLLQPLIRAKQLFCPPTRVPVAFDQQLEEIRLRSPQPIENDDILSNSQSLTGIEVTDANLLFSAYGQPPSYEQTIGADAQHNSSELKDNVVLLENDGAC